VPDAVRVLVVVAHEPTLSELTLTLAGRRSDQRARQAVQRKFSTCGIAVLRHEGSWFSLAAGRAVLETFAVPRG
jgi:phosphohistidine phosphatase